VVEDAAGVDAVLEVLGLGAVAVSLVFEVLVEVVAAKVVPTLLPAVLLEAGVAGWVVVGKLVLLTGGLSAAIVWAAVVVVATSGRVTVPDGEASVLSWPGLAAPVRVC
jgi:hypothetical protein